MTDLLPPPAPVPTTMVVHEPVVDNREPRTRKKLMLWDRGKILVVLCLLFGFLVWNDLSDDPFLPFGVALRETARDKWWVLGLIGVEIVRQMHFFVSERSTGYHRFWMKKVFGRWDRRVQKMSPWTRFRIARVAKWAFAIALISIVFASRWRVTPIEAFFQMPTHLYDTLFSTGGGLPFIFNIVLILGFAVGQFVAIFWFMSRGGVDTYFPEDIKTRFSDVWGQDPVLNRVKENMVFLDNPESVEEKGGHVPGGILLWGPPGTGKTLMAEAVAGETGKPFVFVDPGAFQAMFMGVGIMKVKALFRKLRKLALRYGGVIVFFDEADSLGNRGAITPGVFGQWSAATGADDRFDHLRWLTPGVQAEVMRTMLGQTGETSLADPPRRVRDRIIAGMGMGGGGMGTLQALLTELSGLKKPRGFYNRLVRRVLSMKPKPPPKYRILVMMATNMPQALDEALLRPGRLDRIYKVGYPSKEGRKRTYWGYLDKVRHTLTDEDVDKLATITPYASGAVIKDTINEALINAIRDGRDVITWPDVVRAKHLKELGPPEDVEYIERERHAVAIHEACHAVAAYRVRQHLMIDIATIEKGGSYLGMVSSIRPEDQFTQWRTEYESDIVVSLASLAGERLFFDGDNSSGVSGDLESATTIATLMEGYWGMGTTVTSHGVTQKIGIGGGGRPGTGDDKKDDKSLLRSGLGQRIEDNLAQLLDRAEDLLEAHRIEVLAVAHALEVNKTLSGEDVTAVIEGRRGPLVDGRPYHAPQFLEMAEHYHQMAVLAHKDHDKLKIPLPRFDGPMPQPVPEPVPMWVGVTATTSTTKTAALAPPKPTGNGSNGANGTHGSNGTGGSAGKDNGDDVQGHAFLPPPPPRLLPPPGGGA